MYVGWCCKVVLDVMVPFCVLRAKVERYVGSVCFDECLVFKCEGVARCLLKGLHYLVNEVVKGYLERREVDSERSRR